MTTIDITPRMTLRALAVGAYALVAIAIASNEVTAKPFVVKVDRPPPPNTTGFRMGTADDPTGESIGINSRYLTRDGHPWMPVMGEFHFSRCPADEWREELLRMKAGGIDIAATYVFWNHHEEVEGQWDWSGRRNLREFIRLCDDVGLLAAVRIGPWCHGEVRNGGIPDWALQKGWRLRSNDAGYLEQVRVLYGQIAKQLDGLLWKDGGPVMAIQFENEYRGPAEHLLTLKRIARDLGLDVPLYTRTGWPNLGSPLPFGEIAPLYGAYAEGFWDRRLRSMPGKYWAAFRFMHVRTDSAIATEQLGERAIRDQGDSSRYPFLTCELGGGMMSSYHRRILIHPEDIEAVALVKVGSGGNLPGYYMYHGGLNPEGRLTTLMEQQSTPMTNYNDMPVKNYDFQAPLGAFGQTRPHYHRLRRMHLLFRDFGAQLAPMPSFLPEAKPQGRDDLSTARWAVRSDGLGGFLFVNNHQRGATLPQHSNVQFVIRTPQGDHTLPEQPCTVQPGARFIWPFHLKICDGVRLESATAQLVCKIDDGDTRTLFFAESPGVPATFAFSDGTAKTLQAGRGIAMSLQGAGCQLRIVLLSEADSLGLWKGRLAGRDRVVLSGADVIFENDALELRAEDPELLRAWACPPLDAASEQDGVFGEVAIATPPISSWEVEIEQIRPAGPPRKVSTGRNKVAVAPSDEDFSSAAVWKLSLPEKFNPAADDVLLRIHYRGDVARLKLGESLVMDDFYNGLPLDVGLRRFAAELRKGDELILQILPFSEEAPIYQPQNVAGGLPLQLDAVQLVPRHTERSAQ